MRQVVGWLWFLGSPRSPLPVLAVAAAIMFSVQLFRPIYDVDIFWQVKLGEITLKEGLPKQEPFLAGKQHEPLVAVAWLGQVLYAAAKLLGGWPLLRFVDAAVWFAGFYLVARQCARQQGNDWPAAVGLLVGFLAAVIHASIRPQSWAVLCFGLLIVLLRSNRSNRLKFIAGAVLLVLWQNLHPSVVIAIGYLAARAAVLIARKPWLELMLLAVAAGSTIMTPAGTAIFAISKYNEEISKERGVSEWQPMWWHPLEYGRDYAWFAFHAFAVLIAFALITKRKLPWLDLLPLLGLTALTVLMHRFAIFWGVAAVPVFADLLARPRVSVASHPLRLPLSLAAAACAIAPPMILRPAPFFDWYCFEARDALTASGFRGTIYCDFFWGGVLSEAGWPDWHVTHDGRYYLFTRDEWQRYNRAAAGCVPLESILEEHRPDAFVLMKDDDDGLIDRLRPAWPVLYEDRRSIVFVKPAVK